MEARDSLLLIVVVTAAAGWCAYVWLSRGPAGWRRAVLGVFAIASVGGAVSASLNHRPVVETVLLAVVCGVLASAVVGAIHFNVWIRSKGEERRAAREGRSRKQS
jgi:hypothetical protein